jgi:predicted  nucleic acid-binding Zn-ribbon protein
VCIICLEHGEFWQTPSDHLSGRGCPKCGGRLVNNTEEFIQKAKEVHGDKYDYSKVEYVNSHAKVCIICPEHGEFWQSPNNHLNGKGCPKCINPNHGLTTEEFIQKAREVHGDKYDYSKVEYKGGLTKVCIICPKHGEFWQIAREHLRGQGCPICNVGYTKKYKFNLLEEFESDYDFRAFLANNDVNILYVILRNIEPKFDPIKRDIERALAHSNEVDPIKALRDKYTSDSEDELDEDEEEVENETEDFEITTAPSIDLDDDDAIDSMVTTETTKEVDAPTIEDIVKNTQREIKVINKIEHMLTPEDREYIMNKFLNDKRRIWMAARENRNKR